MSSTVSKEKLLERDDDERLLIQAAQTEPSRFAELYERNFDRTAARHLRSLGMGLDEKAIEALRKWRFEPGKRSGIPVAMRVNVEVYFRLY